LRSSPLLPGWPLRLLSGLRHLLPSCCALCGQQAQHDCALCAPCRRQFFSQMPARCRICAMPLPDASADPRCGDCLREPPAFDATVVAADYAAPIDQLVLALKFGEKLALAPLFAQLQADALLRLRDRLPATLPSLLTAVPLSAKRLMSRGFNQTLEIARPLSRLTGIALAPQLLTRLRDTRPQARLAPGQRRQNIASAFAVSAGCAGNIAGRHIGVVDDVITTGQTLNEIAATLKRHGAVRVTNLVFARTLR
jgi:ComF family protein